jgi:arylsulfatase A-like enzyme
LNEQRRLYDEYLAYVDAEFGRFYDFLDESGVLEDTYLIVTADHGQLFERKIHGHVTSTLYDPLLQIPLLIARPGQREREDLFAPTSCVDILPTLFHITGKPIPAWCEGQVLPGFGRAGIGETRGIYAVEAKRNRKMAPLKIGTVAWIRERYKLIRYIGFEGHDGVHELYDLRNDPEEREDLSRYQRRIAAELSGELTHKIAEVNHRLEAGEI